MTTVVFVIIAVLVVAAIVVAAGGLNGPRRVRRTRIVERPAERVVERRVPRDVVEERRIVE